MAESPLHEKTIVVTGGSSGIGRATAIVVASAGANLLIQYRRNQQGAEDVRDRVRQLGRACEVVQCDFAEPSQRDAFCDRVWSSVASVDGWIHLAGADVLTGDASEWTFEKKLAYLWRVDVESTIQITRAVGQRMLEDSPSGDKTIVTVGWDQADRGMEGDSGQLFAATKAAVMAHTRSLAQTLGPQVRVNGVAPGWIQTSWGQQSSDYWKERAKKQSLMQRWGRPEDVADVICFLVSPQSAFVAGQILPVNGGFRYFSSE